MGLIEPLKIFMNHIYFSSCPQLEVKEGHSGDDGELHRVLARSGRIHVTTQLASNDLYLLRHPGHLTSS